MAYRSAIVDGILISILICGWISVILMVNPRYEMKNYPSEIVKSVAPQTRREKIHFVIMALPLLAIIVFYLVLSTLNIYYYQPFSYDFVFFHLFIVLMIWNLVDLLLFDWLIFCKINPKFMVLPGTEGHPAYKNYNYHFIGFIKGIVFSLIGALIIATIVFIVQARMI